MTPALAPAPAPEDEWAEGPTLLRADALCLAGFASLCAGGIHAAAIGAHSDHDQAVLVFTNVAGFQLVWGALAVARSSRLLALTGAVGQSEQRRVGQECVRLCRSRWSRYHYTTKA